MSVAIGQGAVVVTPLQLAHTVGAIAWGGTFSRPHLAFRNQLLALGVDTPDDSGRNFPLSESTLDALTRGMWGVVNEGEGTGGSARCPGIDIAGKTGTAQVVSVDLQKSERTASFKNNAWFVGFAPSIRPEIVVAALVMRGEHSTVAVPIAREVIKAYFDKKAAQKPPLVQTQNQVRMLSKAIAVQSTRPATLAGFR